MFKHQLPTSSDLSYTSLVEAMAALIKGKKVLRVSPVDAETAKHLSSSTMEVVVDPALRDFEWWLEVDRAIAAGSIGV